MGELSARNGTNFGIKDLHCKKIAKLRQSCDSFCVHKMHETTFVCLFAIDNFCLHYYNWQLLFALLQLITFVCTTAIDNIFIHLELTNIVLTIATVDMCLMQSNINNVRYINCNGTHKLSEETVTCASKARSKDDWAEWEHYSGNSSSI